MNDDAKELKPEGQKPVFTAQDAGNLITIAQRAPLHNMAEAAAVSVLLEKFKAWYESTQS